MAKPHSSARFPTTDWIRLARAGDPADPAALFALESLCRDYWPPLYAYARRRGLAPEEAEDAVQDLLTDLIERGDLTGLDPSKGRFRSFLRAACDNHLANRRDRDRAARRGGGRQIVPIDRLDAEGRYDREPAHGLTAERLFERQWVLTLLGHVLRGLEAEAARAGKAALFEMLRPSLQGDPRAPSAREIGAATGMSEVAVRVAAHRLRVRYRELLRAEVARTNDDPAAVDAEIAELMASLAAG